MKKLLLSLVICFAISSLSAQQIATEKPYSFTRSNISYTIDEIVLPSIDNQKLLMEDVERKKEAKLFRVGVGHDTKYTLTNCGRTDITTDGGKLWRVKFNSKDAIMMTVVFDYFNIPTQAKMFMYSPDREQVFGPYTNADVQEVGKLVTDNMVGDELILEYYEPADADFNGDFRITAITHAYRDYLHVKDDVRGPHGEAEGNCHINVACPEAADWHYPINSVVCIEMTAYVPSEGVWGVYMCSGAMVNNTRMDKTPYVLSANHCVAAADQTYKFYFNYETATCNGTTGASGRVSNGGKIIARSSDNSENYYANSDFLLLKITGMLGIMYRDSIFFAGWDRSGGSSLGAGIHHPGGDWKKISFPRVVNTINSGNLKNKYFNVYWYTNPTRGVTEQGSSGSPLFNSNSLIIGTLTAGTSGCNGYEIYGDDYYGRLAYHWTNNNATSNNRKLQPWLDPDNTGAVTLAGMKFDGTVITGVKDYASYNTFNVNPNPANGNYITINGDFFSENAICNIYNIMGQLVTTKKVETSASFQINISDLQNGVYIVEILGSERTYKSKLVISK